MLRNTAGLLALAIVVSGCAAAPEGPPASTTAQSMALPPAAREAAQPAGGHAGMTAEQHRAMAPPR